MLEWVYPLCLFRPTRRTWDQIHSRGPSSPAARIFSRACSKVRHGFGALQGLQRNRSCPEGTWHGSHALSFSQDGSCKPTLLKKLGFTYGNSFQALCHSIQVEIDSFFCPERCYRLWRTLPGWEEPGWTASRILLLNSFASLLPGVFCVVEHHCSFKGHQKGAEGLSRTEFDMHPHCHLTFDVGRNSCRPSLSN